MQIPIAIINSPKNRFKNESTGLYHKHLPLLQFYPWIRLTIEKRRITLREKSPKFKHFLVSCQNVEMTDVMSYSYGCLYKHDNRQVLLFKKYSFAFSSENAHSIPINLAT